MKKEDYIKERILTYESMKRSATKHNIEKMVVGLDNSIERVKNLSDEEFEKVLFARNQVELGYTDKDINMSEKLAELGLTLEDLDRMTMEECVAFTKEWTNDIKK